MVPRKVKVVGLSREIGLNNKIGLAAEERTSSDGRRVTHVGVCGKKVWVHNENLVPLEEVLVARNEGEAFGMTLHDGLIVGKVNPAGAARRAGITPGKQVEAVNGEPVTTAQQFLSTISGKNQVTILLSTASKKSLPPPSRSKGSSLAACILIAFFLLIVIVACGLLLAEQDDPHQRYYHHRQQQQQQHQRQRQQRSAEDVPTLPDYYSALELPSRRESSASDVKSAFRKLSRKLHPDKGGDRGRYEEVRDAYDVLIDPRRRKLYDVLGLNQEVSPNLIPQETGPADVFLLKLTLDDIYNGAQHTLQLTRNRITSLDKVRTCQVCQLQPATLQLVRMGPMTVQQHVAPDCRMQCHTPHAVKQKDVTLDIEVTQGVPEGYRMHFPHESHEYLDRLPADIELVVETAKHKLFTRKGNDLFLDLDLPLVDALIGFTKTFKHMDGHEVKVASTRPTAHGTIISIKGEGMPHHEDPASKGDLHVTVKVVFPGPLKETQVGDLNRLFAGIPDQVVEGEVLTERSASEEDEDETEEE